ncbi:hypothetical protein PseudUWO311_19840 [Pseudanabaena sp. UWO311]|uniref:DUF6887 family protein n=1 Tax=Pseudanabaena sp. UWO311 TaxID=2487337 RepID=UPI00115A20BF|nr:hypothetical protein [Pseudanabaena sp. UWO311]TYQ24276.1 hypothetical protein PseudUWO311_19840 [Pseudanabaena sp. UWO311]
MIQPDYKQMTRTELREYMLAHRDDEQAFHTYMDKVQQEAVKTPINDEVIADPQKFATFIEQNKQRKQQEATVQPTSSFSQNFHSTVYGVAGHVAGNQIINVQQQSLTIAVMEIQALLTQLAQDYPEGSPEEKQTVAKMELRRKVKEDPTLKDRLLSAIKSGGIETVKVLTNNPFVSIPLETVKGWLEAEPQK